MPAFTGYREHGSRDADRSPNGTLNRSDHEPRAATWAPYTHRLMLLYLYQCSCVLSVPRV